MSTVGSKMLFDLFVWKLETNIFEDNGGKSMEEDDGLACQNLKKGAGLSEPQLRCVKLTSIDSTFVISSLNPMFVTC